MGLSRVSLLLLCAGSALLGCTSRTLDSDGEEVSSGDEASSAPGTSSVPPTTGAPTTASPTTGQDPTTSTPSTSTSTSGPDPSTTTTTSDPGETTTTTAGPTSADPSLPGTATEDPTAPSKVDMGETPSQVPPGIWRACSKDAPPGTVITGQTQLGPVSSTRAYFAYIELGGQLANVRLLFVDDSADLDVVFQEAELGGSLVTGPLAEVFPAQQFTEQNQFWVGTDPGASLRVVSAGKFEEVLTRVEITGHQGSWDVADPADPARLQGTIEPVNGGSAISGTFDAVFCDTFSWHVIPE